jgi:hypothetical protein
MLERRYARGEINQEELQVMRQGLQERDGRVLSSGQGVMRPWLLSSLASKERREDMMPP